MIDIFSYQVRRGIVQLFVGLDDGSQNARLLKAEARIDIYPQGNMMVRFEFLEDLSHIFTLRFPILEGEKFLGEWSQNKEDLGELDGYIYGNINERFSVIGTCWFGDPCPPNPAPWLLEVWAPA